MATNRLDLEDLMSEIQGEDGDWEAIPAGTTLGHVHLHVADIPRAEAFYHGVLGFDIMARYGPQASFLSAGGYHHHLGINTWAGVGAPPPPPSSAGLEHFTVYLPDAESLDAEIRRVRDAGFEAEERDGGFLLSDPSRNRLLMTVRDARSG
jgi:catechol 2,3-dioxygenase